MMHWLKWARLIGIVLLLWILWTIDWKRILPTLRSLKIGYFAAYIVFFACMTGVRVLRLHLSARWLGFPLRLADSYTATVEPIFMGAVTPGRIGELSRIAYLHRLGMPLPSAIVFPVLERVIDLCTLLAVASGGVVYLFGPPRLRFLAFGLIAVLLVLLYLIFAASNRIAPYFKRPAARLFRTLSLPGDLAIEKLWPAFRHAMGAVAPLIEALAIVCAVLNLCQIYMLACAFGFGGSRIPICFAYTVSTIMALLPISPGGLGTREATYIYIMARQGIGREQALLFSLLEGVVFGTLAPVVMVVPLWLRSGLRRLRTPAGPGVTVNPLLLVARSIRKRGIFATAEFILSELSFDWRFHSETRTPVAVEDLAVASSSKHHAAPYQGSTWFLLKRLFRSLVHSGRINPRTTCLIDFGCGKGRVLLAALHFEIARVIGVEFDPGLCAIARRNLSKYSGRRAAGKPPVSWEVIHGDVLDFSIPGEANLFFLYNPFSGPVLETVAERIRQACADSSRQGCVVYVNPVHAEVFRKLGFAQAAPCDDEVAIYILSPDPAPNALP